MSNITEILQNRGVGIAGIKTDERSLVKALQKLELMWNYINLIGKAGYEVVNEDDVITHNNELVYHVPAAPEVLIEAAP